MANIVGFTGDGGHLILGSPATSLIVSPSPSLSPLAFSIRSEFLVILGYDLRMGLFFFL